MGESFTVLWTNDRCRWLRRCGEEGRPLEVLFGGIHTSAPSLRKAGVSAGDYVYPVRVLKGDLYIVARTRARRYVELKEYAALRFGIPSEQLAGLHEYKVHELIRQQFPAAGQYVPYGCDVETLLGEGGTPIRFDLVVPPETLEGLTFCSGRRPQGLKHLEGGKLRNVLSLQGHVRRLCPESAAAFEALVLSRGGAG